MTGEENSVALALSMAILNAAPEDREGMIALACEQYCASLRRFRPEMDDAQVLANAWRLVAAATEKLRAITAAGGDAIGNA